MDKEVAALKISGHPDYSGVWYKNDVLDEMTDILGHVDDEGKWISWVLDHQDGSLGKVSELFVDDPRVASITVLIDNRRVVIEKIYNF